MTSLRTKIVVPVAIVSALLLTPTLTSCAGIVNGLVNKATGGQVDLGGKKIPDNFPKDEVPIIDGEIVYGAGVASETGKAWSILVKVDGVGALDTITSELEGAGFTTQVGVGGSTDSGATAVFTSDKYDVAVVIADDGKNGAVATYTVATNDSSSN